MLETKRKAYIINSKDEMSFLKLGEKILIQSQIELWIWRFVRPPTIFFLHAAHCNSSKFVMLYIFHLYYSLLGGFCLGRVITTMFVTFSNCFCCVETDERVLSSSDTLCFDACRRLFNSSVSAAHTKRGTHTNCKLSPAGVRSCQD